jgi:hypothetical protein
VKKHFPGGDGGQWYGRGFGKIQGPGFRPNDALVDKVIFRVGTWAYERAGIKHLVTRFEIPDLVANAFDDTGSIEAKDGRVLLVSRNPRASFDVDGVDRTASIFTSRSRPVGDGFGMSMSRRLSAPVWGSHLKNPIAFMLLPLAGC